VTWTHGAELVAALFAILWCIGIAACWNDPPDRRHRIDPDDAEPLSYEDWSKERRSEPYR